MVDERRGPTPAGGTRHVAYWWDADGYPCPGERAYRGELVEYDGDEVVSRTYVEPGPSMDPPDPDLDSVEDHDLLKRGTWDLWAWEDGGPVLVETLEQLMSLYSPETAREELSALMGLPAWDAAPARLRREANEWMVATRPGSPQV